MTEREGLLTVDEVAAATGLSTRTTRYYASRGLLPPPVRHGRIAYYGPEHRARLELIRALQDHGFTLQAIERFFDRLPADVTVEDLAMQRAMITSWTSEDPREAFTRIGRQLRDLGLPRDALSEAQELVRTHMESLAQGLTRLLRDQIADAFERTHHAPEEAARLEQGLPRLRQLTVDALVVAFQEAANEAIRSTKLSVSETAPTREQYLSGT